MPSASLLPVLGLAAGVGLVYWGFKGGASNFLKALNSQGQTQTQTQAPSNAPKPVQTQPGDYLKGGAFSFDDSTPLPPANTVGGLFFGNTPPNGVGYQFPL